MKQRLSWGLLLWTAFLILVFQDIRNLKHLGRLFKEFYHVLKKDSAYEPDGDFILVHKHKPKL